MDQQSVKNLSKYNDQELIELLNTDKSMAEAAFTEVYNRYSSIVHAYCYRIFNNRHRAEDIFQETFIKFYRKIETGFYAGNIPGFLITIARNLALNDKRDTKEIVNIENIDFVESTNFNYEQKELLDLITMSLDLLSFEFREAFVLREYDGLPYSEIATICGTSISNAKSRVFRAKQKIKTILAPYMKEIVR
jgi:RNA polymerase sigma-70 factor (ECF subfamily)